MRGRKRKQKGDKTDEDLPVLNSQDEDQNKGHQVKTTEKIVPVFTKKKKIVHSKLDPVLNSADGEKDNHNKQVVKADIHNTDLTEKTNADSNLEIENERVKKGETDQKNADKDVISLTSTIHNQDATPVCENTLQKSNIAEFPNIEVDTDKVSEPKVPGVNIEGKDEDKTVTKDKDFVPSEETVVPDPSNPRTQIGIQIAQIRANELIEEQLDCGIKYLNKFEKLEKVSCAQDTGSKTEDQSIEISCPRAIPEILYNVDASGDAKPFRNQFKEPDLLTAGQEVDDGDQSFTSATMNDLSYEDESQDSVIEVHKLYEYTSDKAPVKSDVPKPVSCESVCQRVTHPKYCDEMSVLDSFHEKEKGLNTLPTTINTSIRDSTELTLPYVSTQCFKSDNDQELNLSSASEPRTDFNNIDVTIAATQNFSICYSPLMSTTQTSSNPGSPRSIREDQAPEEFPAEEDSKLMSSLQVQDTAPKAADCPETELASCETESKEIAQHSLTSRSVPVKYPIENVQTTDFGQNPVVDKINDGIPILTTDLKQDMQAQEIIEEPLISKCEISSLQVGPSVENAPVVNDISMDDDLGVTDSQICAINYVDEIILPDRSSCKFNKSTVNTINKEYDEGHEIMRGLIKDISNINKMLLKTKREMEAFRRSRGYAQYQNKNW